MRTRHLVAVIAIAVLVFIAFLMATKESPKSPSGKPYATNGPLAGAYEMAQYIGQLRDSVPNVDIAARDHLKGLQAIFFVSDYVMAAKTNRNLALTQSTICHAFTNVSLDTSSVTNRLALWVERPGTLADHYRSIMEFPEYKQNILAIEQVMAQNGIGIDLKSDLLMDCIRYVVQNTGFYEMYGPNPRDKHPTPSPEALAALIGTSDPVFRHRFETKSGMKPQTVTNLMEQLKQIRLIDLTPSDIEIPARIQ